MNWIGTVLALMFLFFPASPLHAAVDHTVPLNISLSWNTFTSTVKAIYVFRELQYYRDCGVTVNRPVDFYLDEIASSRQDPENLVMPMDELLFYIIAWNSDIKDRDELIAYLKRLHEAFLVKGKKLDAAKIEDYSKQGMFKDYYENGRISEEWPFKDGKIEGWRRHYDENGNLTEEVFYRNSVANGLSREYHPNGRVKVERRYADGEPDGGLQEFDENGKLLRKCRYVNGKLNGPAWEYFSNGVAQAEMVFKDDEMVGIFKYFDESGRLLRKQRAEKRFYEKEEVGKK